MKLNLKNGKIIYVLFLIGIYLLSLIILPYFSIKYLNIKDAELAYKFLLIYNSISIVIIIIFTYKYKINSIEKKGVNSSLGISILYAIAGFLIAFILQILFSIFLQILAKLFGFNPISSNTAKISAALTNTPIFMFYVVFLAPILEELIFRKAIFGYFYDIFEGNKYSLRFLISSILSGILFAIPHDGFSPLMLVYIVISMIFCFLYKFTGRISTSIIAHSLMNLIVVIIQLYIVN